LPREKNLDKPAGAVLVSRRMFCGRFCRKPDIRRQFEGLPFSRNARFTKKAETF